jgi:HEAT repeat protein
MARQVRKKRVTIHEVLTLLLDENKDFPSLYLHQFSDLEGTDLEALQSIWPNVPTDRRVTLLADLEVLSKKETLVSFDNIARFMLKDPDPRVRMSAIRLLAETDDKLLAPVFIQLMNEDPDERVRAHAAEGLAVFVYRGELEEIPTDIFKRVEEQLLQVIQGNDTEWVRRVALGSIGFSGRKEVSELIREAYRRPESEWVASALLAMGRSADAKWAPEIIQMLRHPNPVVQVEAVRAAGELELQETRRILLGMIQEPTVETGVRREGIWSLSKIGGEDVREILEEMLEETEDDEEVELLEDALDNLSFTEDMELFGMFDFSDSDQLEALDEYFGLDLGNENAEDDEETGDGTNLQPPPSS